MTEIDAERCPACHRIKRLVARDGCRDCLERYGRFLLKANVDTFDYMLKLTSGETLRFSECVIDGDWIFLIPPDGLDDHGKGFKELGNLCPRGLSVPLRQIVWVADAPEGS